MPARSSRSIVCDGARSRFVWMIVWTNRRSDCAQDRGPTIWSDRASLWLDPVNDTVKNNSVIIGVLTALLCWWTVSLVAWFVVEDVIRWWPYGPEAFFFVGMLQPVYLLPATSRRAAPVTTGLPRACWGRQSQCSFQPLF